MATLTVRNVPEERLRALKERARRNRRSVQAEMLMILDSVLLSRTEALEEIEASWRSQARPTTEDEVHDWLSASRP